MSKIKLYPAEDVINNFVEDINYMLESQNIFLIVIILSTYSEYIINQLIKKHFEKDYIDSKIEDDRNIGHNAKLKILAGADIIEKSEYETLNALNEARNHIVHNIARDTDKLDNLFEKVKINYGDKGAKKIAEESPPVTNFIYGCISKVDYLIKKFYEKSDLILTFKDGKAVNSRKTIP